MSSTIDVMVQNVQALPQMPQKHVVEDVNAAAEGSEIILWQEITKRRYRLAVLGLGDDWDHLRISKMGPLGGCPISWKRTRYKRVDSGKVLLNAGFPGISGTRYITWVLLKCLDTGVVILVHNFHYPSSAWNIWKKTIDNRKQRQWLWNKGNSRHRRFVNEWVREGYPVIGGGDINRMYCDVIGSEILGKKVYYATPKKSIDELFFIWSDKVSLLPLEIKAFARNSDHDGHFARLSVKRIR